MIRSLRWRLQAWHAVVLTVVLLIFGVIVYHLLWQTRLHQIDAELDRTAEVLTSRVRRLLLERLGPDTGPSMELFEVDPPPAAPAPSSTTSAPVAFEGTATADLPNPSPGRWLPEEFSHLFNGEDSPWYYIVWGRDGEVLQRSEFAPKVAFENFFSGVTLLPVRHVRSRDWQREVIHVTSFGVHVLVGRSIEWDVAQQHASGWLLAASGWAVLTIGLAGGWWMSLRALRPLATMTATAKNISAENLSQRIDLKETDNELGQLANVLNQTFDRLQAAFEHQSRFTADASHELRTPVAVITSQTELALSKPRSNDEYKAALEACLRAARRMRSLIDSLLLLARFDSGRPELSFRPLDLADVARESIELLKPLAEERQITLSSEMTSAKVIGDHDRLAQVVTNLLSNAIRYNHEGGHVELHVQRVNGHAVMTVTDDGIGIPAEDLPHVFERFYRVDKARSRADGGSGLGLAICRSVVEAHGGQIVARSDPSGGTSMEVRLPLPSEPSKLLEFPGPLSAVSGFDGD